MSRVRQHRLSSAATPPAGSSVPVGPPRAGSAAATDDDPPKALGYIFDVTKAEVDLQFRAAERYDSKARHAFTITAALFAAVQAVALREDILTSLDKGDKANLLTWAAVAAGAVLVALLLSIVAGRPSSDKVVDPEKLVERVNALRVETDQAASQFMVLTYIKLLKERREANVRRLRWVYAVQFFCAIAVILVVVELLIALGTLT